jgi:hypothetical protein
MYLPDKYLPNLYYNIENELKERAQNLQLNYNPIPFHEVRIILEEMGVKIHKLSPLSKRITNREISVAFYSIVNGRKNRKPEISIYLEKFKPEFEKDKSSGALERMVLGKQLELKFEGSCFSNLSFKDEKPSREEILNKLKN